VRALLALTAGLLVAVVVASCGSGTAADQARQAISDATTPAKTETKTQTVTKTATQPTRTATKTVTQPAQTVTSSNTVAVVPASTTGSGSDSGGGLEWWAWLLIALGVIGIGAALFALGRRHGGAKPEPGGSTP